MVDFRIENSGDAGTLTFDCDLTIDHAAEIKEALMIALGNTDSLVVNLENVNEVDITCLQLFCSAHRMSISLNKRMVLSEKRSKAFTGSCETAGFERHIGCELDTQNSCLWKKN